MLMSSCSHVLVVLLFIFGCATCCDQAGTCEPGTWDDKYDKIVQTSGCLQSAYDEAYATPKNQIWLLISSGMFMCLMAFGLGSNDLANSMGTSVGSGACTLRFACIAAGIANWLGAVTLGYGVSTKIQQGIAPLSSPTCWACGFCDSKMTLYAVGMFCALVGASLFLLLATHSRMPVSTTHAIVGGVVGMTLYGVGGSCLNFDFNNLGGIVASWFISPILSGIIGSVAYFTTSFAIFKRKQPRLCALRTLPFLYGLEFFIIVFSILIKSQPTKHFSKGTSFGISLVFGLLVAVGTKFFVNSMVQKRMPSAVTMERVSIVGSMNTNEVEMLEVKDDADSDEAEDTPSIESVRPQLQEELDDAKFTFRYLLVVTATLESFAQGANDTANATASFAAVWETYNEGIHSCGFRDTPWWIMAIAGTFVVIGIHVMGYKVIETIGKNISVIDYHRGFCTELSSTATVIIATLGGFPVSTTHCQVGSVVFVTASALGVKKVDYKLLSKIGLSWLCTLPLAGGTSALMLLILRFTVLK